MAPIKKTRRLKEKRWKNGVILDKAFRFKRAIVVFFIPSNSTARVCCGSKAAELSFPRTAHCFFYLFSPPTRRRTIQSTSFLLQRGCKPSFFSLPSRQKKLYDDEEKTIRSKGHAGYMDITLYDPLEQRLEISYKMND